MHINWTPSAEVTAKAKKLSEEKAHKTYEQLVDEYDLSRDYIISLVKWYRTNHMEVLHDQV